MRCTVSLEDQRWKGEVRQGFHMISWENQLQLAGSCLRFGNSGSFRVLTGSQVCFACEA